MYLFVFLHHYISMCTCACAYLYINISVCKFVEIFLHLCNNLYLHGKQPQTVSCSIFEYVYIYNVLGAFLNMYAYIHVY